MTTAPKKAPVKAKTEAVMKTPADAARDLKIPSSQVRKALREKVEAKELTHDRGKAWSWSSAEHPRMLNLVRETLAKA